MKKFLVLLILLIAFPVNAGWYYAKSTAAAPSAVISSICSDANWGTPNWGGQASEAARDSRYGARHYTTVAAWETAIDGIIDDDSHTGEIYGLTDDDSSIAFNGFDDSSNTITLTAVSGQEADGTDDAGAKIDVLLTIGETTNTINMVIKDIEFSPGATTCINIGADNADSVVTIVNCFMRDATTAIDIVGAGAIDVYIAGCLIKDCSSGVYSQDADPSVTVINCTADNVNTAYRKGSGDFVAITNCYGMAANFDAFYGTPSGQSYNISDDTSPDGTGSIDSVTATDQFTDLSGEDYTVKDSDADIYHAGTTISATWFTTHCTTGLGGTTWNSPPSVGCYEY